MLLLCAVCLWIELLNVTTLSVASAMNAAYIEGEDADDPMQVNMGMLQMGMLQKHKKVFARVYVCVVYVSTLYSRIIWNKSHISTLMRAKNCNFIYLLRCFYMQIQHTIFCACIWCVYESALFQLNSG